MPASLPQHHCKIRIKIVGGNAVKSLVNALGVVQESAVEKIGKVVRKAAPQVKVVIIIMPASLPQHHCKIRIKIVGGNAVKSLVNALGVVQESAVEKIGKVVRKAAP